MVTLQHTDREVFDLKSSVAARQDMVDKLIGVCENCESCKKIACIKD